MINKEQLRYDLAMHAAAVMTLRNNLGNPPDMMLANFEIAYNRYDDAQLNQRLDKIIEKIAAQSSVSR